MPSAAHNAILRLARHAALALAAFVALGCDALRGAGELEQAIAREQVAITAYSADVPRVDGLARTFAEALGRANAHRVARVHREDLAAHALPAGKAWIEALRAMGGLDSVELQAVHAPLVGAAAALVAALERVVTLEAADGGEPAPEAVTAQQREVEAALATLRTAERAYAAALALHCAKNRATLTAALPLARDAGVDAGEAR